MMIRVEPVSRGHARRLIPGPVPAAGWAFVLALCLLAGPESALAAGAAGDRTWSPAFDCDRAEGMVEEMICADSILAALDVELDGVWNLVLELAKDTPDLDMIKAEQRGWVKGRNECWKSGDVRYCVWEAYKLRIAEFQALWRPPLRDGLASRQAAPSLPSRWKRNPTSSSWTWTRALSTNTRSNTSPSPGATAVTG